MSIPQGTAPESSDGNGGHPDATMTRAPRQPHTWTACPGSAFNVRCGPNYAVNGKKAPSGAPLYDVVACDAFTSEMKLRHLARVAALPDEPSCSDVPPLLIINFMIPNYPPSGLMSATKRVDGPGWNLVLYCRLSAAVREAIEQGGPVPPALDLWRRFTHPREGEGLRSSRVKMIFGITDTEEPGFSLVTKSLVNRYNYKPFLSKTACSFYSVPGVRASPPAARPCPRLALAALRAPCCLCPPPTAAPACAQKYFEIDCDIHTWSAAALNGFNSIKSRMGAALCRAGSVIEADDDQDLPETMLVGAYFTHLDPNRCPNFDPALTRYLSDERNYVPPMAGSLGGQALNAARSQSSPA